MFRASIRTPKQKARDCTKRGRASHAWWIHHDWEGLAVGGWDAWHRRRLTWLESDLTDFVSEQLAKEQGRWGQCTK